MPADAKVASFVCTAVVTLANVIGEFHKGRLLSPVHLQRLNWLPYRARMAFEHCKYAKTVIVFQ